MNQAKLSLIASAEILGTAAFQNGKKCTPARDAELMKLIPQAEKEFGSCLPVLKAWNSAWNKANANA